MSTIHVGNILRKYRPDQWGGIESYVKLLSGSLKEQGGCSTFYCPKSHRSLGNDPLSNAGHTIKEYQATVPVVGISREDKEQYISIGGNLISFDLPWMLYRDTNINIVHSHALGRIGAVACQVARWRKIPFVLHIHGGLFSLSKEMAAILQKPAQKGYDLGRLYGLLVGSHHLISNADAILTMNPIETNKVLERYPQKKVITTFCPVDGRRFQSNFRSLVIKEYPNLKSKKIILHVGRMDPQKNQRWLLEQIPEIRKRYPDIMVVFVGDVSDESYFRSMENDIKQLDIDDCVTIIKGLPTDDPRLIGLYQIADVFVLPSIEESFGIVLLEAMVAGTITIASRMPGPSRLIDHGHNGWLFDLDEPSSFRRVLDASLTEEKLCVSMCCEAKKRAIEMYDVTIHSQTMMSLYEQLISEKGA